MNAADAAWFSEAVATVFGAQTSLQAPGTAPGRQPKEAWSETVPVIHVAGRNEREIKQWIEQSRLLSKRENVIGSEASKTVDAMLKGMRGLMDDVSNINSSSSAALDGCRHKAWADLGSIKSAVHAVIAHVGMDEGGGGGMMGEVSNINSSSSAALDGCRHKARADLGSIKSAVHAVIAHVLLPLLPIGHFKSEQRAALVVLEEEEKALTEDIEAVLYRLEDEAAHVGGAGARVQKPAAAGVSKQCKVDRERESGLAPEVEAFESFADANGGDTGGWDKDDHDEFVVVLKACKGDYTQAVALVLERTVGYTRSEAVALVLERTVGYTRSEVMQHARWHMDYMDLLVRKRMALAKWRATKEAEREKTVAQAKLLKTDTVVKVDQDKSRGKWEQEQSANSHEVQKEMVAMWKRQKDERDKAIGEAAAERQRKEELRKRIEIEERQRMNKMKLEVARQAKAHVEREQQLRAVAMRQATHRPPDPAQIDKVRERNSAAVARRQELLTIKEEKQMQRQIAQNRILEKVHVEARSDPNRLLKGTAAHMARGPRPAGPARWTSSLA
eukprot:gene11489-34204_t